jgi:hypothetical protein
MDHDESPFIVLSITPFLAHLFFKMETWTYFEIGSDEEFKIWNVKGKNWKRKATAINSLLCPFLVNVKNRSTKNKNKNWSLFFHMIFRKIIFI